MTDKPDISGQLVFWDKGPIENPKVPGRHAVQVFGIMSAKAEIAKLLFKDEMLKHTLYGGYSEHTECFNLVAPDDMKVLLGSDTKYKDNYTRAFLNTQTPDRLLTMPLWRV